MNPSKTIIPSVNFHLWEPCNMRCKFCFATFQDVKSTILPKGHLPKEEALKLVEQIAEYGFKKITFAGGEPTLCPWLPELIRRAKELGMTTMIVTNGSRLSYEYLNQIKEDLDWVALSIDSTSEEINILSGRKERSRKAPKEIDYKNICERIKQANIRLKINTVVHGLNKNDLMSEFINEVEPERWKILKMLKIKGQNDSCGESLSITEEEFRRYLNLNQLKTDTVICPENNDEMKGSYLMIDPAGRFFNNINDSYSYTTPILQVGIKKALEENYYDEDKFRDRGGFYDF